MWNEQPAPAIDAEALDLLVEMIGPDEPAAILDLLDTYIEDSSRQIAAMQSAYASSDFKTAQRMAHSMKSSSATFGALTLSKHCESLEQLARDNCVDNGCASELQQVVAEHARVLDALREVRIRFVETG
jgi:HPt (histidine-containing phosphotransfer) domain-containing protein